MMVMVGGGVARAAGELVNPGISVGPVRIGMTEKQLVKAVGPGETSAWDRWPTRHYPARGFEVLMSPDEQPRVVCVAAGGSPDRARRFGWRSADGIGMGSTLADLVAAWGEPARVRRIDLPNAAAVEADYPHRGISLILDDDQVNWLAVRSPAVS